MDSWRRPFFRLPALALLTSAFFFACFAAVGDGSPTDSNIKYFGRWDKSNATVFHGYWGGAYFRVQFTGTTVKINLGNTLTYRVKIDKNPWMTVTAVNGTSNLTPTPLAAGTHTLIVVQGKDYAYDFAFKGLILDSGAKTLPPAVQGDLIEWIGDSITDGYKDSMSDVSDYAWLCAESLACEHTQIAYPGIALVDGYGQNTVKTGMNTQYFKLQDISYTASANWDFSTYVPKVVVVNIGTNDGETGTPIATYQSTYVTFLGHLRATFPNATMVVMVPHTGFMRAQDTAAYAAMVAGGDKKIHYINATGWLTTADEVDGLHPSDSGHAKLARLLRPLIAPYLTPASPVLTPDSGTYSDSVKVTMQSAGTGLTMRYTVDGSDPTRASTQYAAALTIKKTETVRARAFSATDSSAVTQGSFVVTGTGVFGQYGFHLAAQQRQCLRELVRPDGTSAGMLTNNTMHPASLPAGVYFVRYYDVNGTIKIGRLVRW